MAMRSEADWTLADIGLGILALLMVPPAAMGVAALSDVGNRGCWALPRADWDFTANCEDAWVVGMVSLVVTALLGVGVALCLWLNTSRNKYRVVLGAVSLPVFLISAGGTLKFLAQADGGPCPDPVTGQPVARASCHWLWQSFLAFAGVAALSFAGVLGSLFWRRRKDQGVRHG